MEKMGFSKETHEQGYESLDSRANSQAISEHLSYKESKSSALDSTASKAMKKDNDNDDSNETDQVKGNSEAAESKQIQKQKGGKENSSQLKGIVLQANGHWGAQLYCNRARIWLGTFKTREEAAKAYDRANMKFKGQDGQTNFPVSEAEKLFQNSLTCDEVTLLIRDHIYDGELHKWYNAHHNPNQVVSGNAGDMGNICNQDAGEMGKNMIPGGCMMNRQHLFEKELTVSDVGKLNRLVIPKQHAERHFPKDRLDVGEFFFLTFVDTSNNREWQFRFSFWESSKSYVLTRGWRRFVKNKDLKGGDLVSFSRDSKMPSNKFYITVQVSENLMSNNCVQDQSLLQEKRFGAISSSLSSVTVPELEICTPKKLVKSHEKIRVDQNSDQKSSNCLHGCTQLGKRKAMEDEIEHKSDDVLKLFGIEIGRKGKQLKDVGVEFNPKAKESLEIQIHSKETKQKDDEAEIESKARNLFGIKTDPEAKGQRDGRDVDLTLRL